MRRLILGVAGAAGCAASTWGDPADAWLVGEAAPAPPSAYELTLTASNVVAGAVGTFDITGAAPGAEVRLFASDSGIVDGVCPAALSGRCAALAGSPRRIARGVADGAGALHLDLGPPARLGGAYEAFQAFVVSPSVQVSNPVGRLFSAPGTTLDVNADSDGDGASIAQGDCADFDASIHPHADEVLGDGWDHDCDDTDAADHDRDGYASEATGGDDCDDEDAAVSPEAVEVCNGVDDDCDGAVDNGGCYVWQFLRIGDCTGADLGQSYGVDPDPSRCNAGALGRSAVNWDGITWFNGGGAHPWWTYKVTQAASCSGGGAPGRLFECVYVP